MGQQGADPVVRHSGRSASPAPVPNVGVFRRHGQIVPLEIATRQASRIIRVTEPDNY